MNSKATLTAIATLIIGFLIGYSITPKDTSNMHLMHNSEVMSMSGIMENMNRNLIGKTGDDFDRVFLSEMIVHHLGAVQMAELAASSSKHQEIQDLAKNIIEAQNKEIADMKGWQKAWYNQ